MPSPREAPWRRRVQITVLDVALMLVAMLCCTLEYATMSQDVRAWAGIALVASTVPLVLRTIAPVAAVALTLSVYALATGLDPAADGALTPAFAALSAVYAIGLRPGRRPLLAGMLAAVVPLATIAVLGGDAELFGFRTLLVVAALGVGRAVSTVGFENEALEARAAELERERDERAAAAVAEERARIARELHDLIGHSIAVMGVQVGGVRRKLNPDQERERQALLAVERTGRDAVAEMRRLLGFLRDAEDDRVLGTAGTPSLERTPIPTLGRLGDLVAEMRRAGLDVDLRLEGVVDGISPGRELAAYRIVQEALTNVLKHAPGAQVLVRVQADGDSVEIVVRDDGAGTVAAATGGDGGHGLVGMRERVAMYGGTFAARPAPPSGFEVRATLPRKASG